VHCHAAQAAHAASSSSGSTSRRRLVERPRQQPTRCRAAPQPSGGAGQLLASIRRGQGLEGVLGGFSRQQPPASCKAEEGDDPPPNAPVTPDAFVEALDTLSKSASGSEVNPAQLDEILSEVVERRLLGSFSDAQLVASAKALAVICASVAAEFTTALVTQLGQRLGSLHTAQLSNVGWALLRLVPVTHAEARGLLGMTQAWLDAYAAACEAQLQQVLQLKQQPQPQQQQQQPQQCHQPLPSAQQLANLLLIPAAVQHAPAPELVSLLEQAVVARQHSLCGFAVAQLLTTYVRWAWWVLCGCGCVMVSRRPRAHAVSASSHSRPPVGRGAPTRRLELQPGPDLWAALLEHLTEELLLYDYDELAQVK
jgi:hypothetical protein